MLCREDMSIKQYAYEKGRISGKIILMKYRGEGT
jgi:hypothetical protein